MKTTKNFHFLGKKKYETTFDNPIFLMDSNELDENDDRQEEDVYAYRRRERYLKQKMNEYKEALNKIKHLLDSHLAADGSDCFVIDQDDDVLEVIYGLSKMGEK